MRRLHSNPLFAVALLLAFPRTGLTHDVITTKLTWDREISRIVYKRCASCHRDGGAAMSLITYDDARPWAKAIRDQVVARSMPPWGAVKGVGSFQNDPSLTEVEIQMLVAWVEGGAPKGDNDALAPKVPDPPKPPTRTTAFKLQSVAGDFSIPHPMVLRGLRPEGLDGGQSMLVDAWFPDGAVEHLIWLRDYHKEWSRDYVLREPLKLPAGVTVHIKGPPNAKAVLLY